MRTLKVNLNLNNTEYIELLIPTYEPTLCCSEIKIFFRNQQTKLQLSNDTAEEALSSLQRTLTAAIDHRLPLDHNITQNLGYLWNMDLHQYTDPNFKPANNHQEWVGLNYHVWSTSDIAQNSTDTWIYNDQKGQIVLEITPLYKWHFSSSEYPENAPGFITYDQFMQNYQVYLTKIIPKTTAKQWLEQVTQLLKTSAEHKCASC